MPATAELILNSAPKLSDQKVFEVHLDALKDAYKELIDANQKIAGILLIVLGWFASKDNPLSMLCHIPYMAHFAIGCTTIGFLAIAYLFNITYRRAAASHSALLQLGFEDSLFSRFQISRPMFWCGLFGQFTLLTGIVALLAVKYLLVSKTTCA